MSNDWAGMRVFVSYSRRDAKQVAALVDALEARGYDVWVDTEEIRGNEPWRRSVVDAITRSDVVVLVVSPRSMASENVEREVTVAAEHDRRVVPVVFEPASLPAALQYELAGIEFVSFEDRPFTDAVEELAAALTAPSAEPPSGTASAAPQALRRGRGPVPSWIRPAAVALAVGGAAAVAWFFLSRGSESDDGATGTATTVAGVVTTSASTVRGARVPLDATVWFSGWEIKASNARHVPQRGEVAVDVAITNRQRDDSDSLFLFVDDHSALEMNGMRTFVSCSGCPRLPPDTGARATLTATVDEGFDLAQASIVFGGAGQHQATIPLGGGRATSEKPRVLRVTGSIDGGQSTEFTIEQVDVVPAGCWGLADGLTFQPARLDEVSVVVVGTAVTSAEYPVNFGDARLTAPDGTTYGSESLTANVFALSPGVPERGIAACFTVAAPATGAYRFTAKTAGTTVWPAPIMFTL
jgi:TIR domain